MKITIEDVVSAAKSTGDTVMSCNDNGSVTVVGRVHSQILSLTSPVLAVAIGCAETVCEEGNIALEVSIADTSIEGTAVERYFDLQVEGSFSTWRLILSHICRRP